MSDLDINQAIHAATEAEKGLDPAQTLRAREIAGWSRAHAQRLAASEGIELGDGHWAVIELLQRLYVVRGPAPRARLLAAALNEHFASDGGSQLLYQLFPGGPVAQGSRLAGVPAPHDARDLSFGSTY